ncbi:CheR family methyltransferase [Rhodothermus profundi]|nr:protein-glutamate O-methyltransferase CheR [Rhodothermus profundi]
MSLLARLPLTPQHHTVLSDAEFQQLRQLIYEKTGLYFQDNKRYLLESRVGRRLNELRLPNGQAYLRLLQNGQGRDEFRHLINAITINETYFFRAPAHLEVLERHILPEWLRTKRQVRIWSAGCSSGEEPYTLAIFLRDRIQPRYPNARFEIIGTDINTKVLKQAQQGLYGDYAVRNVPPEYLQRYFIQQGNRYQLRDEIRKMVKFQVLNLADEIAMSTMRNFDLIICANVLIYFDDNMKRRVVQSFYRSLVPGGYLFVGFSETLYGISQAFQPVRFGKAIVYRKEAEASESNTRRHG